MQEIDLLKRRIEREQKARKQAEFTLEKKALALLTTNEQLKHLNETLALQVQAGIAALQKTEKRYQDLVESVQDIIYTISPAGYFTFVNSVVKERLGFTEDEIIGRHFTKLILLEFIQPLVSNYREMIDKRIESTYNEFPVTTKSGEIVWIGQTVRLIINEDTIVELAAVARDITDRIITEQELEKAKQIADHARQAEKQFLANMSHEIRTPLNAVVGMTHLLFDTRPSKQQYEYLDILKSSADFLLSLICDLLDMAKIEAGKVEINNHPFDLVGLLKTTQRLFQIKIENKPIEINLMVDGRISGDYLGDDLILNQILLNIIGNAEKFTEKGSIDITVKQKNQDEEFEWVEFKVEDTGSGIAAEKIDMIFQKFKQINKHGHKHKGTGLGLSITKELVEIQGGTISVSSQEGVGSTFTFTLPYKKAVNDILPTSHDIKVAPTVLKGCHVLVAEDNLMNQKYISNLLTKWNINYVIASDGKKAVEQAHNQRFDIILMDIQMPNMNGYEAAITIRNTKNINQNTPIIALTASAMLDQRTKAMEAGMNDFVTKPFAPNNLLNILQQYIN